MLQIEISEECKRLLDDYKKLTGESYSEIITAWKSMRDEAFRSRMDSIMDSDFGRCF